MMNKNRAGILLLAVVIIRVILVFQNKSEPKVSSLPPAIENKDLVTNETVVKKATPAKKMQFANENLKKCAVFLSEQSGNDLDQTLQQIKTQFKFNEKLEITEYQLFAPNNEQIVVQNILQEEMKNRVRVFKTAADGFPDRLKDFPNAAAGSVEDRLQGALTLGRLHLKIEKYQAVSSHGTKLDFEKSENKVTKINFSNGKTLLTCEPGQCDCKSF